MKALIRNEGETITEEMAIPFIDWNTGAPLTSPDWYGGPYTLVTDYDPVHDVGAATSDEGVEHCQSAEESAPAEETVNINGQEYTLEEARALLGVKL